MLQHAAGPPGAVGVAHQERAEDVGPADDLVAQDPLARLQVVVAAAQLFQRHQGGVAGTIGVVDRGPVDRRAVVPDRQAVGNREGFAVADDHSADAVVRHPGDDPGIDAHPRQADLVARPVGMLVGQRRELLFVRAPAHFGGGDALLAEALDAPGVHELIDLLGPVGDLGVALAAVDHLDAEFHRQPVEGPAVGQLADFLGFGALDLPVRQQPLGDVQEALLRPVRDQPGIGPVLDDGGGAGPLPAGGHAADVHVPPVERPLGGVFVRRAGVGVPDLDRRVDVEHAAVVAPLEDFAAVDVPGEVHQQVARRRGARPTRRRDSPA